MRVTLLQSDWLRMDNAGSGSARNKQETGVRNNYRGLQEVASTVSSSGSGNDPLVGGERCSERR